MAAAVVCVVVVAAVCCMAAMVCAGDAGRTAWRRLLRRARNACEPEDITPWTTTNEWPEDAPDIRLEPADNGNRYCVVCGSILELPLVGIVNQLGHYYLELAMCEDCWPQAAEKGLTLFIDANKVNQIFQAGKD